MVNAIIGKLPVGTPQVGAGRAEAAKAGTVGFAPVEAQAAAKPDAPQLSAFSAIAREFATAAPIDVARIATIRQAIADGTYKVEPQTIAAKMIEVDFGPRVVATD